jgi:hypothetical protein
MKSNLFAKHLCCLPFQLTDFFRQPYNVVLSAMILRQLQKVLTSVDFGYDCFSGHRTMIFKIQNQNLYSSSAGKELPGYASFVFLHHSFPQQIL